MKWILLLALYGLSFFTYAESADALLQAKLNAIQTMKATFNQQIKTKKRVVSSSSGRMALARPGRFRWETTEPMDQLVVADGNKIWVYDKDLEQVTVKKQAQSMGGTAGLFLSGYDETVARDFEVKTSQKGQKFWFDLQAKSNKANFQRVKLLFVGDSLSGIELFDQLGQHTTVKLRQIKTNPKLAANLFKFSIPKGVDVVKQ